jgi:hypothetical protein
MRPLRILTVAATTTAALTLVSGPVDGQEPAPPITVDPPSGPAGTTITYAGDGCIADAEGGAIVGATHTSDPAGEFTTSAAVADDGSWSATYTVGADDLLGTYEIQATCYDIETPSDPTLRPTFTALFDYAPNTYEVTDGPVAPSVLPLAIDPTSGPVGTSITVSGTDCPHGELQARLLSAAQLTNTTGIIDETVVDVTAGGAWSVELVVDDTMSFVPIGEADVEPGDAYVRATCFIEHDLGDGWSQFERLDSEPVTFVITPGGTAPAHDDPQPSPDPPGSRPQASPATPVVAEPSYTG